MATSVPLSAGRLVKPPPVSLAISVDRVEVARPAPAGPGSSQRLPAGEPEDGQRRQAGALGEAVDDQEFLVANGSRRRARPSCRPPARRRRRCCCRRRRRRVAPAYLLAEIGAAAADEIEQSGGARDRSAWAGGRSRHGRGCGRRARPPRSRTTSSIIACACGLILGRRRAHVDAQHRLVGHDIVGAAAVDPGGIDREPSLLRLASRSARSAAASSALRPSSGLRPAWALRPST